MGILNDNKQKDIVQTVLSLMESYYLKSESMANFTIEHILPDNESEDNARIGNLLPLEEELNMQCGVLPLAEKINIYRKSSFVTVKRFVERYEHTLDRFTIQNRTDHIAGLFYKDILSLEKLRKNIQNEQELTSVIQMV
jgi:hypothetical protein